jgi:hypothetical protein
LRGGRRALLLLVAAIALAIEAKGQEFCKVLGVAIRKIHRNSVRSAALLRATLQDNLAAGYQSFLGCPI